MIAPFCVPTSSTQFSENHQIWSANIKLSYEAKNPHYGSSIAVDGNNIYVVWADERYNNPHYEHGSDLEIFFKRSTDGGKIWSNDTRITNNSDKHTSEYYCNDIYPDIAIDDATIYIVWARDVGGISSGKSHHFEIFGRKSNDNGITWDEEKQITHIAFESYGAASPRILVANKDLHLVYDESGLVYYMKRTNGNWSQPVCVSSSSETFCGFAGVAYSNGTLHLVYVGYWGSGDLDTCVVYRRSLDNGATWEDSKRIGYGAYRGRIAAEEGRVYVVYDISGHIYCVKSSDNGKNWASPQKIDEEVGVCSSLDIASSNGNVHVVWQDSRDGNIEIYYKSGKHYGTNWSKDRRLTYDEDDSFYPAIGADGENAYVIWSAYNFTESWTYVYFKRTVPYQGYLTGTVSKPVVKVLSPQRGETMDAGVIWIKGIAYATDPNLTIQKVEVKIGVTGDWEIANGTTNWSYKWHVSDTGEYERYRIFVRAYDGGSYSEYYVMYVDVRPWNWWLIPYGVILIGVLLTGGLLVLRWYLKNKTLSKISTISLVIMWALILFVTWYVWQFSK